MQKNKMKFKKKEGKNAAGGHKLVEECPFVCPAFQVFVFASSWTNLHARLAHNEAGRPGWAFLARRHTGQWPHVDIQIVFFSFFLAAWPAQGTHLGIKCTG